MAHGWNELNENENDSYRREKACLITSRHQLFSQKKHNGSKVWTFKIVQIIQMTLFQKSVVIWPYAKLNRKKLKILAFTLKYNGYGWPNVTVITQVFMVAKLSRGNLKSIIISSKILLSLKNTHKCITANCFGIASNSFPHKRCVALKVSTLLWNVL